MTGFAAARCGASAGDCVGQILRGRRDQDDVRSRGNGGIVSHFDARLQLYAGSFGFDRVAGSRLRSCRT